MKSNKKLCKILAILLIFSCGCYIIIQLQLSIGNVDKKDMINSIETSYKENKQLSKDYIKKSNEKLSKVSNKDSEYYFIKGYFDYSNEEYKKAIKNFELAKEKISKFELGFVKIYTHILLNKSYLMVNQYDNLVENCEIVFNYMSKDKKYKNDNKLAWDNIDVLVNSEDTIAEAAKILKSYIYETKGLNKNIKAKLISNLGSLYSFDYKYAQSMYSYLDALNTIKDCEENNYDEVKIITNIGDINYILNNYKDAIKSYDKALSIKISDKKENATSKSIAYVNKADSYIELKEYDKAIEVASEITTILPYLDENTKDDIEILRYNILALAYTYKNDFDEAESFLKKSINLLKYDEVEFSKSKYVFTNYSYARLYKEKGMYDEALSIFEDTLQDSTKQGLGLEKRIYYYMSEIYRDKRDLNNYIKYNELYINEEEKNEQILKDDYMDYSKKLYETDKLKEMQTKRKINSIILLFIIILLIGFIVLKIKKIKKLQVSNFTDQMTNLYNRKYLDYYISKNIKTVIGKDISVILLDIDYFKKYNDNYGHIKGDEIIKEVADSLKNSIRKKDIAVRYGGEEMVLILPDTSIEEAKEVAKRVHSNIKDKSIEHKYSEVDDILTVSTGIYTNTFSNNQSIYDLIDKADKALYKSKNNGRNRYEIFYDEM